MTTYKSTYLSAAVHFAGDNPIINEQSTTVRICDEAGGAFVSLTDSGGATIRLEPVAIGAKCGFFSLADEKTLDFLRLSCTM